MGNQDAFIFTARNNFHCNECGNPRSLLADHCAHCGSSDPPHCNAEFLIVNLEFQSPSAEQALGQLEQNIRAAISVGLKILMVLHGYGSTGMGGRIRNLVRQELQANRWADCVREFIHCEALKNRAELGRRVRLSNQLQDTLVAQGVLNNSGCTLLLLRKTRLLSSIDKS